MTHPLDNVHDTVLVLRESVKGLKEDIGELEDTVYGTSVNGNNPGLKTIVTRLVTTIRIQTAVLGAVGVAFVGGVVAVLIKS